MAVLRRRGTRCYSQHGFSHGSSCQVALLTLLLSAISCCQAPCSAAAPVAASQRFLVARHGQTTFNAAKRFQGTLSDEPVLTEKGRAQASALGSWLRDDSHLGIGSVFVSPLLRAVQTLDEVRKVAKNLPPAETLHELREIELYEWQGLTQTEVQEMQPEDFRMWKERAWELRLGGGRPVVQDLWDQATRAWALMRSAVAHKKSPGPALVVAHGTLGKALLSTALGLPATAFRHFSMRNGEVVEVAFPADVSSNEGVVWRKHHPSMGDWRGLAEEQDAIQNARAADVPEEIS